MSVWTITETPEKPIPRPVGKAKTTYVIVTLPANLIVARGTASKSISADLDPGKYRLVVSQMVMTGEGRANLMKWRKDFYHEVTEAQHKRILSAPLRFTKGMLSTEGTRYICQLPGCSDELTSRTAAVLHEAAHSGVNLLTEVVRPGDLPLVKVNVDAVEAQMRQEKQAAIDRLRQAALKQE